MVGSWPPIAFSRRKLNNLVRPTSRTQSKYTRVYYLFTVRTQPSHLAHVPGNPSWPGANFPQGLGRIYTPPPGFFSRKAPSGRRKGAWAHRSWRCRATAARITSSKSVCSAPRELDIWSIAQPSRSLGQSVGRMGQSVKLGNLKGKLCKPGVLDSPPCPPFDGVNLWGMVIPPFFWAAISHFPHGTPTPPLLGWVRGSYYKGAERVRP